MNDKFFVIADFSQDMGNLGNRYWEVLHLGPFDSSEKAQGFADYLNLMDSVKTVKWSVVEY